MTKMSKNTSNGSTKTADAIKAPLLLSCRLNFFIMGLLCTISFMFLRLNINFALVCMVRRPNITALADFNTNSSDSFVHDHGISSLVDDDVRDYNSSFIEEIVSGYEECKMVSTSGNDNGTLAYKVYEGVFEWSKETQGNVLGAFFYGFIFTQILGGWISDRFGGKKALIASIGIMSLLSLISPFAAWQGPEYLFGIRLIQGFSHGATLPCINVMASNWSPPTERSFLLGITYGGFSIAMALIFPVSAFLCENFGWEYIFYGTGAYGVIWGFFAYFLIYDWPEDHPRISQEELQYLKSTRTVQQGDKLKVPWRKIVCSMSINVIHLTHFCMCWGFYIFVMYLPTFMKEVLKMSVSQNGLYSSFPFVAMLSLHFFSGSLFDFLRRKNFCSLGNLRKIFNTIGMICPAIGMAYLGFLSCTNSLPGMLAISVLQAFVEFAMMGGYLFSCFDLAPRYAGILTGISNTFGNVPGFLCPVFVAYMTPNGIREEWITVFFIAAAFNVVGAIIYLVFGKSTLLPWAAPKKANGTKNDNLTEMKILQEKLLDNERKV